MLFNIEKQFTNQFRRLVEAGGVMGLQQTAYIVNTTLS